MKNNFDIHEWNRNRLIESTLGDADLKAKKNTDIIIKSILKSFPELDKLELRYAVSSGLADITFNSLSEVESNTPNPIDTITTDVPLFIRLLEYAKEDAETDMDLHNVAENSIRLSNNSDTPLTMENYDNIISQEESLTAIQEELRYILEEKGYSPLLITKENPKGKTKGLDNKTLNKILKQIATKLQEAKPGLWANIRAKKARGEKPSHGNSKAFKSAVESGKKINNKK